MQDEIIKGMFHQYLHVIHVNVEDYMYNARIHINTYSIHKHNLKINKTM